MNVCRAFRNKFIKFKCKSMNVRFYLSDDGASGNEIKPCNKIDISIVVYRFSGNVMTSITTLRI